MPNRDIDNSQDVLDVRDIIERFEELEGLIDNEGGTFNAVVTDEQRAEFHMLKAVLLDIEGRGGDEEWRGRWYPVTLIRDSYFEDYAQEMLEDCGDIPKNLPSYIAIDWAATARNIRVDYTSTEFDGVTYWYR